MALEKRPEPDLEKDKCKNDDCRLHVKMNNQPVRCATGKPHMKALEWVRAVKALRCKDLSKM